MKPYYDDGSCVIYHGNSLEIMPSLQKVGLVVTDPPFGGGTHSNAKSNRGVGHGNKAIDFDSVSFDEISKALAMCGALCDRWVISFLDCWHIAKLGFDCPDPLEFIRFGVWVKTNPMPQISSDRPAHGWDGIAYMHNKNTKKRWNGGGNHGNWIGAVVTNGWHPTAKPLALVSQMVSRFSEPGDTVLDPFMGSGTTLRAAKDLGRISIGCELSEEYCERAAIRLQQESLALDAPNVKTEQWQWTL